MSGGDLTQAFLDTGDHVRGYAAVFYVVYSEQLAEFPAVGNGISEHHNVFSAYGEDFEKTGLTVPVFVGHCLEQRHARAEQNGGRGGSGGFSWIEDMSFCMIHGDGG